MTTAARTPPSTNSRTHSRTLSGFFGIGSSRVPPPRESSHRSPSPVKNEALKRASVNTLSVAAAVSSYRSSPLGQKARHNTSAVPQMQQSHSSTPPSSIIRKSTVSHLSLSLAKLNNTIAIQRNRLEFTSTQLEARDSLILKLQGHEVQRSSSPTLSNRDFDLSIADYENQLSQKVDEIASLKMKMATKDKVIQTLVGQLEEFNTEIARQTAENDMIQSELNQKCAEEKELLKQIDQCNSEVAAALKESEIAKAELVLKSNKYESKIADVSYNLLERDRQLFEAQQEIDLLSANTGESQGLSLASELKMARISFSSSTAYSPSSIQGGVQETGETGDDEELLETKSI
ncbi:hypothetical protein BC830DRAFT_1224955 [Chytriomyces sp. MP71]|nr:hypothetical protein BC830DRAFT_1224955 [Chytriomyces sp. MP71]